MDPIQTKPQKQQAPRATESEHVAPPAPAAPSPTPPAGVRRPFRVVARHTPCPLKAMTVDAVNDAEALDKFCEANKIHAHELLKHNKKSVVHEGVGMFQQMRHLYPDVSIEAVAV